MKHFDICVNSITINKRKWGKEGKRLVLKRRWRGRRTLKNLVLIPDKCEGVTILVSIGKVRKKYLVKINI